jgi:hypothetical protein
MQTLTIQRIYQISREQFLYLISFALVSCWVYWTIEYFVETYQQRGHGELLIDDINQLYLLYSFTPAVYAFFRSSFAQRHRLLRFALKTYLGFVLTISVISGAVISYIFSVLTG